MNVRKFEGRTTAEALKSLKGELGADAIIHDTRTLRSGRVEIQASRGQLSLVSSQERARPAPTKAARPAVRLALPQMPDLRAELEPVRALLRDFLKEADASRKHSVPPVAAPTFLALVEAGVSELLAKPIAIDAAEGAADEGAVFDKARVLLAARLPVSGELRVTPGERKVVAFVGPTGVGKTTVLSKLAAMAALQDGLRVGLIAADVSRIGALDQIRRYAEVLGAAFAVAPTQGGLTEALAGMTDVDLVLIDTAGRSARDADEVQALADLFERPACRIERHLCLSANAKERDNAHCVEHFRRVGYHRVLFTKLDETSTFGGVYGAVRAARRPLSYVTRSPHVPEALEPASAQLIAELILPTQGDADARAG